MADNTHEQRALTEVEWDALETLASRLEEMWKKGVAVDLAGLLPSVDDSLRKPALVELVKVDLECRWRRGQPVVLDYYVDKFPELGKTRDLPPRLVFEEYRVRHIWGDKPSLALYQTRFPGQYDAMKRLIDEDPMPTMAHLATERKPIKTKPIAPTKKEDEETNSPQYMTVPAQTEKKGKESLLDVGQYKMLERLGAGAFGEVWRVVLPGGIFKAVKVIFRPIDHEEAKRELESLELVKSLRHHFLLQTISFRPTDDRLYILMDLADCSLRDLLKKAHKEGHKGLPVAELVRWLREAAEALDYLHEKGVQHRDIKPENILLSEGSVRVADFGLARHQATRRLVSGSGAGTPLYMPPEAWNDKVHANSDQYSLAATYAECRLGKRIYESDGLASLMQAHVHDKPKLDGMPPDEQQVLLKALAKKPDNRYPSCQAFAEALIRAVAKTLPPGSLKGLITTTEEPAGAAKVRKKQKQQDMVVAGVSFLALATIAAILAAFFWPTGGTTEPKDVHVMPAAAPAGPFRPVADTEQIILGDRIYYNQIECVPTDRPDLAVRFNLIPWTEKGKTPYYVMENKVSNDLFRVFAEANPSAVNGSRWRLGARGKSELTAAIYPMTALLATSLDGPPLTGINWAAIRVLTDDRPIASLIQEDWPQPEDLGAHNGRWPVLRVDIREAQKFAEWLGGFLPSVEQWDKAAGRFEPDRGEGPYIAPFARGEIAVDRDNLGPLPVGSAPKDMSRSSKCRDMAGNGFEWTRTILFDQEASEFLGDSSRIRRQAKVPLRGHSFKSSDPLTYADLDENVLDLQFYEQVRQPGYDSQVGFRVVLMP